ncbi:MAG: hypothetical protein ACLFSU_04435 [Acholeplasmataceae bacterium]
MDVMAERYINEVKKRVDADQRDAVERDLRETIEDREGQELIDTLRDLGHPREVAARYSRRRSYLISPAYFPYYRYVRKIVLYAVALIITVFASIDAITGMTATTLAAALIDVFAAVLWSVFIGVISAYGLVTLAFSWFESRQIRIARAFDPRKMTELTRFSRDYLNPNGTLIETAFLGSVYILLLLAFTLYRDAIGWYDQGIMVASLYVEPAMSSFAVLLTIGFSLVLTVDIYLLYKRTLTTLSAVLITVKYGYALIVFSLILKLPNSFDPRFIAYYAYDGDMSFEEALIRIANTTTLILGAVVLLVGLRLAVVWFRIRRLQ